METPFVRAVPARDPLIGRLLHDRYQVQKRIGKGGMGIVYLAEHVLLRRKVALKTLSDRAFASEEMVARFQREAMAAAAVGNEHVVGVTDMGQLEDGSYFIVLEYLDGVELGFAVGTEGPLPLHRALHIASQLCDALTAVHAAGIVHRDLKPENLFLIEREGTPDFLKVLDFGVCKAFEDQSPGERPLTHTGASLGTPQFMAPEQIDGSEGADHRADIYAAGAILYFALTGEAPFQSPSLVQLFMRVSTEPPPSLHALRPDLPPALDAVIARALQKRPEDRYQSSAELLAALQPFARADADAPARRASSDAAFAVEHSVPPRPSWRPHGARRYAVGILLACLLFALSVAVSSGVFRRGDQAARARPRSAPAAAGARPIDVPPPPATSPTLAGDLAPGGVEPAATVPVVIELPGVRTARARRGHAVQPAGAPAVQAVEPPTRDLAPDSPPATSPPTPPKNAYGLSQRGLKDIFE